MYVTCTFFELARALAARNKLQGDRYYAEMDGLGSSDRVVVGWGAAGSDGERRKVAL